MAFTIPNREILFDVLIRGAGELASACAIRLFRAGYRIILVELEQPLCIRRTISFSDAVYDREVTVEGIIARRLDSNNLDPDVINLVVDASIPPFPFRAIVDARMLKKKTDYSAMMKKYIVGGIGPGFHAPHNCHFCVETQRGYSLGRTIYQGATLENTGVPAPVLGKSDRVIWAPCDGVFQPIKSLGDCVKKGEIIGKLGEQPLTAPIDGLIRGLLRSRTRVKAGTKIADIDPRNDPSFLHRISDKGLAVAGGVLEGLLHFGIHPSRKPRL